jgi:hypothetical protein
VLCIKIQIQIKYIKYLQGFSRIASAFIKFKHEGRGKNVKQRLRNEENGIKKNRREVRKWVRKDGLKFGSCQDTYPLYLKVS